MNSICLQYRPFPRIIKKSAWEMPKHAFRFLDKYLRFVYTWEALIKSNGDLIRLGFNPCATYPRLRTVGSRTLEGTADFLNLISDSLISRGMLCYRQKLRFPCGGIAKRYVFLWK